MKGIEKLKYLSDKYNINSVARATKDLVNPAYIKRLIGKKGYYPVPPHRVEKLLAVTDKLTEEQVKKASVEQGRPPKSKLLR